MITEQLTKQRDEMIKALNSERLRYSDQEQALKELDRQLCMLAGRIQQINETLEMIQKDDPTTPDH